MSSICRTRNVQECLLYIHRCQAVLECSLVLDLNQKDCSVIVNVQEKELVYSVSMEHRRITSLR